MANDLYSISVKHIDGKQMNLASFKGKALVIVNTASACGYTPQYKELQKLYEKFKAQGLFVLGFPSNDFGGQEPGTDQEIKKFCSLNYKVTFPMFTKLPVSGPNKQPVYQFLLANGPKPDEVKWNFEKFVVDRQGRVVARFDSKTDPLAPDLIKAVETALKD